ncbi:MAG: hypothetical protein KAX49_00975 [Halanaerobiales bacterium]|nr:hypothetical protein [Halanaerobiales bacterium]
MTKIPDLIGMSLEEGLDCLRFAGLAYRLLELKVHNQENLHDGQKRIVRQRLLDASPTDVVQVEIVYSIDTYQLGK